MVAGNFRRTAKGVSGTGDLALLALVLVYMVLACQYESLRDPLVVMFSVPLAAIGVLVTLFMTKTTLNVQSYIGCIMLGGIVVNNAISAGGPGRPAEFATADVAAPTTTLTTILIEAGRRRRCARS
jgi:HAE1 family hydrophobic/amphiphilic exporter-1